jgi:hypothetical protein
MTGVTVVRDSIYIGKIVIQTTHFPFYFGSSRQVAIACSRRRRSTSGQHDALTERYAPRLRLQAAFEFHYFDIEQFPGQQISI